MTKSKATETKEARSGAHNTAENATGESNLDYATTLEAAAEQAGENAVDAAKEAEPDREFTEEELSSIKKSGAAAYYGKVEEEDEAARQEFINAKLDSTGDKLLQVLYLKHVIGWNDVKHILK